MTPVVPLLVLSFATAQAPATETAPAPVPSTAPDTARGTVPPDAPSLELPALSQPVTDVAAILDDATAAALTGLLEDHRKNIGVAVGVLIVPTFNGVPITTVASQSGVAFANDWAKDFPWVLVVISVGDRMLRIEGDPALKADFSEEDAMQLTSVAAKAFATNDTAGGVRGLVEGIVRETPRAPPRPHTTLQFVLLAGAIAVLLGMVGIGLKQRSSTRNPPPVQPS